MIIINDEQQNSEWCEIFNDGSLLGKIAYSNRIYIFKRENDGYIINNTSLKELIREIEYICW